jgi:hypothetical protein
MGGMFSKPKKANTAKLIKPAGQSLLRDLPQFEEAAGRATAARLAEIERVMPGATRERQIALANLAKERQRLDDMAGITSAWMRGEVPRDVQAQTMRGIAEFAGAGFNPATAGMTGGFQAAQGMVPRQLGLQSLQLQQAGFGYEQQRIQQQQQLQSTSMAWQQLADTFTYDPFEAAGPAQVSMQAGMAKAKAAQQDAEVNAANQQSFMGKIVGTVGTVAAVAAAPFTGGASLIALPTTLSMMGGGGGVSGGGMGGGMGGGGMGGGGMGGGGMGSGIGSFMQSGIKGLPTTGFGGQTYMPSQGGDLYKPLSGSIFQRR